MAAWLAVGCAGVPESGDEPQRPTVTSTSASSTSPTSGAPTPDSTNPVAMRCGAPDVKATPVSWRGPVGNTLRGFVVGAGPTVAVFVHQTGRQGLCGFMPYAAWLAGQGVRSVLVDLCTYGTSVCDEKGEFHADYVGQMRLVTTWAQTHGARRITLVGASMGGTIAMGSAKATGASAVVDLSGPITWPGITDTDKVARVLTIPLLVAASAHDTDTEPAVLRSAVGSSPAKHKRFVSVETGHGWGLLSTGPAADPDWTPIATLVRQWIRGDYART